MSCPSFIAVTFDEQCLDLRTYLKSLGAEISEESNPDNNFTKDVQQIIDVCHFCFKEENETDIETALNSIVNLLCLVPHQEYENVVLSFCEKISKAPNNLLGSVGLRVLRNLYEGLDEKSPLRYYVYYNLVKVSGQTDSISEVFTDLGKLKEWFQKNNISDTRVQNLLRLLHEQLLECKQSELASNVMIELLSTYTEDNASQARDDAHRCIVASLGDPNTFLLDHLLALKPVKFLEGELIHDLLTIFVSEQLVSYLNFYNANKDFINSVGLSHEQNMKKMRYLTFMQLAENRKEIPFDAVEQALQISPGEVEKFVIDIVKTKMVRVKMNQTQKTVVVDSTIHRTFGKAQWQQLRETLMRWRNSLTIVEDNMTHVVNAQIDRMKIKN